jgi:nicotinate-nucleotide adenylyltransferase
LRIGILGGTFNPPHIGHLICAQEAHVQLGLDLVLLMPVRTPPHKTVEDEPGVGHRLELCRLAVAGDQRLRASSLEAEREGPSYTVATLVQLHACAPESELYLIVGGDIAAGLPSWREPERVLSLATLAVAKRRGTRRSDVRQALASLRGGERAVFFAMPRIALSSTIVRRRVREGLPIRYLVPDAVAAYIEEHHLYGGRSQT